MDRLLRRLTRTGLRKGLAGEHWAWFVLAAAAYVLRRARRREDLVTSVKLEPGDRYLLSLNDPRVPEPSSG